MIRVGDLWVTVDRDRNRIVLVNDAGRGALSRKIPRPDVEPSSVSVEREGDLLDLGTYSLADGPACRLRFSRRIHHGSVTELFRPLQVARHPDMTVDYTVSGDGRRAIWMDDQCIREGFPVGGENETATVNLVFEFLLALLSRHDLLAMLHASSVRWEGRCIVMMGPSGSGKSTLAAQLVAMGGTWLGDDYVALSRDGSIIPLPTSPSLKSGVWPILAPDFPQLASARSFTSGDKEFKYLAGAPATCGESGPAHILLFPRFSRDLDPKAVRLTPEELLYHLSRSGLWLELADVDAFMRIILGTPAYALRHTPDLGATIDFLRAHAVEDRALV